MELAFPRLRGSTPAEARIGLAIPCANRTRPSGNSHSLYHSLLPKANVGSHNWETRSVSCLPRSDQSNGISSSFDLSMRAMQASELAPLRILRPSVPEQAETTMSAPRPTRKEYVIRSMQAFTSTPPANPEKMPSTSLSR
jgi:hypothetical protein